MLKCKKIQKIKPVKKQRILEYNTWGYLRNYPYKSLWIRTFREQHIIDLNRRVKSNIVACNDGYWYDLRMGKGLIEWAHRKELYNLPEI